MPIPKKNEHQKRSRLQEMRVAKDYSGTRTPGSGNGWIKKADVRASGILVECKTTTKNNFNLRSGDLAKLWRQGLIDDRCPVLEIEFANDAITAVVLDKNDYMAMRSE